ncbi:MAG TPA: DmsE family decaheme c-type cytochrome [candidate division Zixibacteria bacterium]|nr:DmsE family decaheme c-type cytochrome [candidate division Zixibacteria bacterium]MDD4917560.1 DmsE family decaheme c-type cytochrome [candidate division Zixibacteria bacterium]MDM7972171.1 DmsE family decaheme c-type cytochrome [candidate division Zixibacteria bacterium]HOD66467.1 DmsE family decaheme c-type cytochrome [candidate division Zixibacteria bacterium]HOZ06759.1 DmsE family decaheme c-type cytochrome [candidate division Zixibacteria bacterium]
MGCLISGGLRIPRAALAAAGLALALLLVGPAVAEVPDSACAGCHDIVDMFHKSPHGAYFAGDPALAAGTCEACHGSAVDHVASGDPADIINPARADQFGAAALCLNCHKNHQFDDWAFSAHYAAGVTCASCHRIHAEYTDDRLRDPALCYSCHAEVRAAAYMPSHHPIAEGKMRCLDCHSVHGGGTMFVKDMTNGELCFSCHAEKEGPFIYEHSPVQENCMICHSPHGTVANSLLKQNEPALCLDCHPMHFHAAVPGIGGTFQPPAAPERRTVSTRESRRIGMLTKCTQCHTQIHGSDLPSQSMSARGAGLTR